jgi:hypothetical protein
MNNESAIQYFHLKTNMSQQFSQITPNDNSIDNEHNEEYEDDFGVTFFSNTQEEEEDDNDTEPGI